MGVTPALHPSPRGPWDPTGERGHVPVVNEGRLPCSSDPLLLPFNPTHCSQSCWGSLRTTRERLPVPRLPAPGAPKCSVLGPQTAAGSLPASSDPAAPDPFCLVLRRPCLHLNGYTVLLHRSVRFFPSPLLSYPVEETCWERHTVLFPRTSYPFSRTLPSPSQSFSPSPFPR